jgi:hypothetical protein
LNSQIIIQNSQIQQTRPTKQNDCDAKMHPRTTAAAKYAATTITEQPEQEQCFFFSKEASAVRTANTARLKCTGFGWWKTCAA